MEHLKYLLSLIYPGCVIWFLYTGPHNTVNALAWTIPLWSLIIFDWLGPTVKQGKPKNIMPGWFYDALLYILSMMQFLIISLLLIYASQLQWNSFNNIATSLVNLMVLRILVGTSSGSSAIIVAHELIHRAKAHQRTLGHILMYTVCYEHFVIAHLRGHHPKVATPDDIATARLNESFDSYWKRVVVEHFSYAWQSELQRIGISRLPLYHYKMFANAVFQGLIIEVLLLVLILTFFGWAAVVIFLYQAVSGVRLLETINYYQHWGLEQGQAENSIAWVNPSQVTEYALLGLSNHIDHHKHAKTPFYRTINSTQGPKMSYGYFVTNLWVKLNNESYQRVSMDKLY